MDSHTIVVVVLQLVSFVLGWWDIAMGRVVEFGEVQTRQVLPRTYLPIRPELHISTLSQYVCGANPASTMLLNLEI